MIPQECRRAREAWSEEFDRRESRRGAKTSHLDECPACRAFAAAATAARSGLQSYPEPAANPLADLTVLQALQPQATNGARSGAVVGSFSVGRLLRSAFSRSAAAGVASFAATLILAQVLSHAPAPDSKRDARDASQPLAGTGAGYLVNRIELWTGAAPDASLAPAKPNPVAPRPGSGGKPPTDQEDAGDRADRRSSLEPLG